LRNLILMLFSRQRTPLHCSAAIGTLGICRLLLQCKSISLLTLDYIPGEVLGSVYFDPRFRAYCCTLVKSARRCLRFKLRLLCNAHIKGRVEPQKRTTFHLVSVRIPAQRMRLHAERRQARAIARSRQHGRCVDVMTAEAGMEALAAHAPGSKLHGEAQEM
jgi:hypothetical protein